MTTKIAFNGSKFLGVAPASIDVLVELLGREPLDPRFEHYGDFCIGVEGPFRESLGSVASGVVFFGNFLNVSHAFSISTDDPEIERRLFDGIMANKRSDAYRCARAARLAGCNCTACFASRVGDRAKPLSASKSWRR